MEFSCDVTSFRNAVSDARRAISANPPMVAYSALLVKVTSRNVKVTGSNGETTVTAAFDLESDSTSGQVLIPPKPFVSWLSKLDSDSKLDMSLDDSGDLCCLVDGSPYTFRTLTATYTVPPRARDDMPDTAGDLAAFDAGVAAVRHATREAVQVVSVGEMLTLTATDNYRLAHVRMPGCGFGDRDGVASLAALEAITRHQPLTKLGITENGREMRASNDRVTVSTRLLSVPFPSVETMLSQDPPNTVEVEREALTSALGRLATVADKAHARVSISGNMMEIQVANAELGTGIERVECTRSSTELECGVSPTYLLDAVEANRCEKLTLGWSTPRDALRVQSETEWSGAVICLLMPVSL